MDKNNYTEIFRKAFDLLPVPAIIIKKIDDKFTLKEFNFSMIKLTETRVTKLYNRIIEDVYGHRQDILKEFYSAYNNMTVREMTTSFDLVTTGKSYIFKINFIYLDFDLMLVVALDVSDEYNARMKMAESIYNTLTLNEKDVLYYMVRGFSRQDIANSMGVRLPTIYSYIDRIREKSGELNLMIKYEKMRQADIFNLDNKYS